jgi:hypothetical protein
MSVSSIKNIVITILVAVAFILLLKNYLAIRDRDTEWLNAPGEIGSVSFVEFRPNVGELYKLLLDGNITLVEVVKSRLDTVINSYPYLLQNSKVVSLQGDLSFLIAQFNCLKLKKNVAVDN